MKREVFVYFFLVIGYNDFGDNMKLEELENYRKADGFINIDDTQYAKQDNFRETRGSQEREKDWIQLEDCNVLLRTELFGGEESNYCNYAELIVEELAKQVDFPSAHYDLITYKGKRGVLSQDVRKRGEEFHTLMEFIGAEKETSRYSSVPIDFDFVINGFRQMMKNQEFYPEEVLDACKDLSKLLIFDTYVMGTDRHTENIGLLTSLGEDGKKHMKLAPAFDNECSLMLDIPSIEMQDMLDSPLSIQIRSELQEPLIALSDEESEPEVNKWEEMIELLTEKEEFFDFAKKCNENMNIEEAIQKVEERIGHSIPTLAKTIAEKSFNHRKQQLCETLLLDLEIKEENKSIE